MFRVEVSVKDGFPDPRGEALQKGIDDFGIMTVTKATSIDTYLLEGNPDEAQIDKICQELLADPIVEEYSIKEVPPPQGARLIEVAYNPGVMDPVEESVRKGIRDLGITAVESVKTI